MNPNFALGSRNSSKDAGLFLPKKGSTVGNATLSLFSSKNSRPRSPRFSRPNAKVGMNIYMFLACLSTASNSFAAIDDAAIQKTVEGNNSFAVAMYRRAAAKDGNQFLSPVSISFALAMTYAGARGGTEREMKQALHFHGEQKELHPALSAIMTKLNGSGEKRPYELVVANALWGQRGHVFLNEYLGLMKQWYNSGLMQADFALAAEKARTTINWWVEEITRNKIKDLIPPGVLTAQTRLVLTNAVYFKGAWRSGFQKERTRPGTFYTSDGKQLQAQMMHQKSRFRHFQNNELQALELPYKGDTLSMVIFLPKQRRGLDDFESRLGMEMINELTSRLSPVEVEVTLPKFKMTASYRLEEMLGEMGMNSAFVPGHADFSGMDGTKGLFISAILHKAFVDVNEEGTEAAAATAVAMALTSMPERHDSIVFKADHPFMFLIRDNATSSIIFIGRITAPRWLSTLP